VLAVHDEFVVEADAAWLKQMMIDGMQSLIDPVPVEVKVGRSWGTD
jgi:hypothetical protein